MVAIETRSREELLKERCASCQAVLKANPEQEVFRTNAGHILTGEIVPPESHERSDPSGMPDRCELMEAD
jgi:hypothetical protein